MGPGRDRTRDPWNCSQRRICNQTRNRLRYRHTGTGPSEKQLDPMHVLIQRGGAEGPDPSMKNHKNIGFLSNTGPDPLKNQKATKPAFNVGPTLACQQNAI